MAPRRKREAVHLIFKAHERGDRYGSGRLPKKTRTVVVEHHTGLPWGMEITKEDTRKGLASAETRHEKTMQEYYLAALAAGKKLVAGESGSRMAIGALREFHKIAKGFRDSLLDRKKPKPELRGIKLYFDMFSTREKIRHALIRDTIRDIIRREEGPLEANYGTAHSLLSGELRQEGIEASREIRPQVFTWQETVARKIIAGKKVADAEYRKGFVSMVADRYGLMDYVLRKEPSKIKERESLFYGLFENALISRLSEEQIDRIIETRNHFLLLDYNNLPRLPSRRQVEEFLKKHSGFWRRQQRVRERQEELRRERMRLAGQKAT